jgi:hypothetical protein
MVLAHSPWCFFVCAVFSARAVFAVFPHCAAFAVCRLYVCPSGRAIAIAALSGVQPVWCRVDTDIEPCIFPAAGEAWSIILEVIAAFAVLKTWLAALR